MLDAKKTSRHTILPMERGPRSAKLQKSVLLALHHPIQNALLKVLENPLKRSSRCRHQPRNLAVLPPQLQNLRHKSLSIRKLQKFQLSKLIRPVHPERKMSALRQCVFLTSGVGVAAGVGVEAVEEEVVVVDPV